LSHNEINITALKKKQKRTQQWLINDHELDGRSREK